MALSLRGRGAGGLRSDFAAEVGEEVGVGPEMGVWVAGLGGCWGVVGGLFLLWAYWLGGREGEGLCCGAFEVLEGGG